ncbi:MAG TPA: tetratricopeptide repeat protein [Thermoanaerobaculia bacterium]|jgi:tetratricopeptide (TPR) repeat protein
MTVSRPNPDEYARFLQGDLDAGVNRRFVRHLLAVWRVCRGEVGQILEVGQPLVLGSSMVLAREHGRDKARDYDPSFDGLLSGLSRQAQRVAQERQRLPQLIARLREVPLKDQCPLVRSEAAFHSWLLGEWLIEESQRSYSTDLGRAKTLARCAVTVAEELDSDAYGAPLINDLKARSWAYVGEALRLLSDLRSSEEAFETAEGFVSQGTGDALEEARVLELRAALYRDQHRPDAAHGLLDDVIAIYRQYRDLHLLGRAFIQKGRVYGRSSRLQEAIAWLRKGLGLIDPSRECYLDLAGRHSLMLYLHESGRSREARFLLKASRPEFLQRGSPLLILRLRWLEGKIYEALQFPREAERALTDARRGFADLGSAFSAAAVSLDLAALYASQGRTADMRTLAEEILPVFQARDLQREAIAALIAFQQAARMEMNATLLAEIRSHLDQARQDPKLRFESV